MTESIRIGRPTQAGADELSSWRRLVIGTSLPLIVFATQLLPCALGVWIAVQVTLAPPWRVSLGVLTYLVTQPLIAGALSLPFHGSMIPGRFPRDLGHRVYGGRRLFGACWAGVYYNPFTYHVLLSIPPLKRIVFRLFGYRGCCSFTLYPDTWIRDLPLVSVGRGAYLSNKATISPNIATPDGRIVVAPVAIGERALIGHGSMIAPGVAVGAEAVVGAGCAINFGAVLEDGCTVGSLTGIDQGARIGKHATIGTRNGIAARVIIGPGLHTPTNLSVRRRCSLLTQIQVQDLAERQGIANRSIREAKVHGIDE